MDRTRIRWKNVGRLAGGVAAGAALIAVVPGLLQPGAPAPLPPDVGLETVTSGAIAYADKPPGGRERREHPSPSPKPQRRGRNRPRPERQARPDRPSPPAEVSPTPSTPPPVPPASPPPAPPPPPAAPPPPSAPPPAPSSAPPPAPAPPDHIAAEYGAAPTPARTQSDSSQFGFEH